LSVIPEGSDGVAVEVAHDQCAVEVAIGETHIAERALADADGGREVVHKSLIEGRLFCTIVVILIASGSLGAVKAEGIGGIGIVGEEIASQAVH
jgi:hypothetical protein